MDLEKLAEQQLGHNYCTYWLVISPLEFIAFPPKSSAV